MPRGSGSEAPYDFNGDGHPDLVVDDLLAPGGRAAHDDDPGIGIVYGSARGLVPGSRRLLTPSRNAAPTKGVVPAAFEAGPACDLDGDGFTDLVVTADPPYDGVGRPPVPVQLLFGSPRGLAAGRAVPLRIPERARDGNEWPDQPTCGDFDGDGATDLAVTASGPRISYLRGPFSRRGAPKAAAVLDVPGTALAPSPNPWTPTATAPTISSYAPPIPAAPPPPGWPSEAPRARPARVRPSSGHAVAFGRFRRGSGTDAVVATGPRLLPRYGLTGDAPPLPVRGRSLHAGDITADGYTDLIVGDPSGPNDAADPGAPPRANDSATPATSPTYLPGSPTGLTTKSPRLLPHPHAPGSGPRTPPSWPSPTTTATITPTWSCSPAAAPPPRTS